MAEKMWKRGKAWHEGIGGESDALTFWPNKALDRMRGSAVSRSLQSNVIGALPLIGQLFR